VQVTIPALGAVVLDGANVPHLRRRSARHCVIATLCYGRVAKGARAG
jgi:hypothetical protein